MSEEQTQEKEAQAQKETPTEQAEDKAPEQVEKKPLKDAEAEKPRDAKPEADKGAGPAKPAASRRRVAVVAGLRTPFCKAGTLYKDMTALDLSAYAAKEMLERAELDPNEVQELVWGIVIHQVQMPNIAREVALRIGLPKSAFAHTVSMMCVSSNRAMVSVANEIERGHIDCGIAGGVDNMSDVPILFSKKMSKALVKMSKAKGVQDQIKAFQDITMADLAPVSPAIKEYSTGLLMGESAELMAQWNGITREEQDDFAFRSHSLAAAATADGRLTDEMVKIPIPPDFKQIAEQDNGIRMDPDRESMAGLKPAFDKAHGTVTAANACPLTDGAACVLLMAEEKAKALGMEPMGYIRSYAQTAIDPAGQMLLGPGLAAPIALDRAGLGLDDLALIDFHEAFAAQVLSNLRIMASRELSQKYLRRPDAVGEVDMGKFNVMGGSIAIGHPFGATGARMVTSVLNELRRRDGQFGLVALCAAGGIGMAMVLERE